ncbi:septum site-determining protein MinD [Thermodesulfobium narugense DSM 14796]|uniref:Septum site-determining protein MinD n=1 Tax=Thermodesulfobium narugense DSM 14796 TaxID=747365 RepID=M1E762_9BACT|nr:septum site-determining protein MinD [Thermodesulfobium narugense]AEE14320.1 septum site-determining protein MinD [Thermodesulfobium narugense DSM 14796]
MGKCIVVTSGKGGVGKTTTSANLGGGLASLGKSVLLADVDIGLRNLDIIMGLEKRIVYDVMDVMEGRCKIQQAIVRDKRLNSLYLLAASQIHDKSDLAELIDRFGEIIKGLKKEFDYVILDSPAGIEQGFMAASNFADEAIVVTTPEVTAVRDADRVIGLLEAKGIKDHYLILNRYRYAMVKSGNMLDVEDVLHILGIQLLGIVPEDPEIITFANRGELVVTSDLTISGKAFQRISRRLIGEKVDFPSFEEDKGLFNKIKNFFKAKLGE